jgi:A/G-specific adenine glycosylase
MTNVPALSQDVVHTIQKELLEWYDANKRDLPWRQDKDPYKIWVSEIMLQQTRVDTVIPYFKKFINQFPTLNDLAQASDEQVVKAWEGLGYYSRVRNLHSAVKEVAAHYGGKVPDEPDQISKLKGVGPYTTGAILSIAYDKKVPAVDGNVMRVFSRLFALTDDIARVSTRKKMEKIADLLIPEENPGDFNQALMELGAMICTPTSPQCLFCPVRSVCHAYEQGIQNELPYKKKAKPPVPVHVLFVWISWGNDVLLEKRPDTGLLAGMWGLPTWEINGKISPLQAVKEICQKERIPVKLLSIKGEFDHIFSHRRWKVTVIQADVSEKLEQIPDNWNWIDKGDLQQKALPNVYQKALHLLI